MTAGPASSSLRSCRVRSAFCAAFGVRVRGMPWRRERGASTCGRGRRPRRPRPAGCPSFGCQTRARRKRASPWGARRPASRPPGRLTSARPAPSGQLRPAAAPSAAGSGAHALQEALAAQVLGDDVFACVSFAFRQRFRSVLNTSAKRFAHCCRFLQCSAWSADRARLRPQRPPMQPLWHTELLFPDPILHPDPTRPRATRPGPTPPDPTRPDPTRPRPTRPGTARTRERRRGTSVVSHALQEALAFSLALACRIAFAAFWLRCPR